MQDEFVSYPFLSLADIGAMTAADTLVLTVNNRLSRRLTLDLAALLRVQRQVSELPRILPLSAWLAEAGNELAFDDGAEVPAYRLGAFATQLVWSEAIRAEEAERILLDTAQAASLAMDADVLMDEWDIRVPVGAQTDEYRGFSRWRARYLQTLARIDAEDAGQCYARVLRALTAGRLALPRQLILAGFTDVSPRFQRLLTAFAERDVRVFLWRDERGQPAPAQRYSAADHGAEWRAAAAWAAERLAADPNGRYAIVSVQLESESPFARRVLSQALNAESGCAHAFNVAVGRPLIEWPAARAALAWLHALATFTPDGDGEVQILGAALLAGHCAGDVQHAAQHVALDARWRRQSRVRIDAASWRRILLDLPALGPAWEQAQDIWRQTDRQAGSDVWAAQMKAALTALGFPGERSLDSVAYQVMGALGDLLGDFAALAPAAGRLSGAAAVRLLESAARATAFQPQRDPAARLDVLGLLEAEGGHWDGIWMLGLTDEVLPASPKPNPLLPLAALRQAGAPRATPERERQWAQAMYAALCCCAPQVIVSHARMDGERELRPSPLIAAAPLYAWTPPTPSAPAMLSQESLDDGQGPPLARDNAGTGGLDVLDTQARNPLWAFVRHRLGGRALEPYADAATVNVRGQFLHKALELVWQMLPDQDALHAAMAQQRLIGLLEQAIAEAADGELRAYRPALRELECERARRVLAGWFDLEAQRTPFSVAQVEKTLHWTRGALALKVRLDRMDRLPDGRVVILDYKTGSAAARPESDWSRARPVNLQLPFYAAVLAADAADADVAALVLAQIHARQIAVQGLADDDLGMAGVKQAADSKFFEGRSWPELLRDWRSAIEALADEYVAGVASNRVYRNEDLKFCDALPFLRLHLDDEDA